MRNCGLEYLPYYGMDRLQRLRVLGMSHNKIRHLPHAIGKLPYLISPNLAHNQVEEVSESRSRLRSVLGVLALAVGLCVFSHGLRKDLDNTLRTPS